MGLGFKYVSVLFLVSATVLAEAPSVHLLWKTEITALPEIHDTVSAPAGVQIKSHLAGMSLVGNQIHIPHITVSLDAEVPESTTTTVRKEKSVLGQRIVYDEPVVTTTMVRKQTTMATFDQPQQPLIFKLPQRIEYQLSRNESGEMILKFTHREAVVAELQKSVDGLPASVLDPAKPSLKDAIGRPAFIMGLESQLSKQLPKMDLGNEVVLGELALPSEAGELASVYLGSTLMENVLTAHEKVKLAADSRALTMAVKAMVPGVLEELQEEAPVRLTMEKDSESYAVIESETIKIHLDLNEMPLDLELAVNSKGQLRVVAIDGAVDLSLAKKLQARMLSGLLKSLTNQELENAQGDRVEASISNDQLLLSLKQ